MAFNVALKLFKVGFEYGSSQSGNFPQSYKVNTYMHVHMWSVYVCIYTHINLDIETWESCFVSLPCANPSVLGLGKENKRNLNVNTKEIAKMYQSTYHWAWKARFTICHLDILKSSIAKEHTYSS